jgi:hypothetical protein
METTFKSCLQLLWRTKLPYPGPASGTNDPVGTVDTPDAVILAMDSAKLPEVASESVVAASTDDMDASTELMDTVSATGVPESTADTSLLLLKGLE